MEPIPLLPDSICTCPDISHIIREEFQELFGQKTFPTKIAQNYNVLNVENVELKLCASEIDQSYNEIKSNLEEITHAEKLIMAAHAKYLMTESEVEKNPLQLKQIFPDIDKDVIDKFGLLQPNDLLPHITERILNTRLPPYEFIYKNPCKKTRQKINELENLDNIKCCNDYKNNDLYQKDLKLPTINSKANVISRYRERVDKNKEICDKPFFKAEPSKIVFNNYKKNVLYEKHFTLRNITNKPQSFVKPSLPINSKFMIKSISSTNKIAPGMSSTFTINFMSELLSNVHEKLVINVLGSSVVIIIDLLSIRSPPLVKALVYYDEKDLFQQVETTQSRNDVLNYCIDCGACLFGVKTVVTLLMQNCGSAGKFFIISEDDWYLREITMTIDDFKLQLTDFALSPAYLELKEKEIGEITIEFYPTEPGLALQKIFIMCDNNSLQEIDLLGDCVLYEPYYIKFEMPTCACTPLKSNFNPKYTLHLGAIYTNQTVSSTFIITNSSLVKFSYEWRKRDLSSFNMDPNFWIQCDWIEINPDRGFLDALSEQRFEVTINMKSPQIGLYITVLSFFILDIPEMSLSEGPIFNFGEEYIDEITGLKFLTVQVDDVEIQVHNISVPVLICPDDLVFPTIKYDNIARIEHIKVFNNGYCNLNFVWKENNCVCDEYSIRIEPKSFEIEPRNFVNCTIYLKANSYDNIDDFLTLVINDGLAQKEIRFKAEVEKPGVQISHPIFDFGALIKDIEVTADFMVKNICNTLLYWRVVEYRYDFEKNQFYEIINPNTSSNCGQLCHQGSYCNITYTLDTTIPKKYFALLVFYSVYKEKEYESSHVIITADIKTPLVSILNENYGETIFKINEEFYQNETITRSFYLHNDSIVEAEYTWGEPFGLNKDYISVKFDYNSGKLYPFSRKIIEVTLTFLEIGVVHDLYVPFSVQSVAEDLVLQICCKIKGPEIVISIPVQDKYIDVIWPCEYPKYDAFDDYGIGDEMEQTEIKEELLLTHKQSLASNLTVQQEELPLVNSEEYLQNYPSDILTYLKNIEIPGEVEYKYPSDIATTPAKETSQDEDTLRSNGQFYSVFGSDTSICEYVVEFPNVKCREVCKKTIDITNNMPIPLSSFDVSVKNFPSKTVERTNIDKILINLKQKFDDTNTLQMSDYGIFVNSEPQYGELLCNSTVSIEINVYAETWGFYLEEIMIEFDSLPTFYLSLVIQVVGFPLEFPILFNSNMDSAVPEVLFGTLSYCSEPQKRFLSVHNNSTIPFKIVWHVFTKDIEDHLKGPVNFMFDLFGFEPDNKISCKLKLVKYFGRIDSHDFNLFTIEPKEIYINPKETKNVLITINPNYFNSNSLEKFDINAMLLGHIYLEHKYSKCSNCVLRNPDIDLKPVKVILHSSIEYPEFNLKCVNGETNISMSINDIFNTNNNETKLRLVFKNLDQADILVAMTVEEPFKVMCMKAPHSDSSNDKSEEIHSAFVKSNCCLEVMVRCLIQNDLIMNIADALYQKKTNDLRDVTILPNNQVSITCNLQILQRCKLKQELPLTVVLSFPLILVSVTSLDFGEVCIGSYKKLTVKLLNKTASEALFRIVYDSKNVFKVKPENGYLKPASVHDTSLYITVYFKPIDNLIYETTLTIETCLSQYKQNISVTGKGSLDEKYYCVKVVNKTQTNV